MRAEASQTSLVNIDQRIDSIDHPSLMGTAPIAVLAMDADSAASVHF